MERPRLPGSRRRSARALHVVVAAFAAATLLLLALTRSDAAAVDDSTERTGEPSDPRTAGTPADGLEGTDGSGVLGRTDAPVAADASETPPPIEPRPGWIEGYVYVDDRLAAEGEVEVGLGTWTPKNAVERELLARDGSPPLWAHEYATSVETGSAGRFVFRAPKNRTQVLIAPLGPYVTGEPVLFERAPNGGWEGEDLYATAGGAAVLVYEAERLEPGAFVGTRLGYTEGYSGGAYATAVGTLDAQGRVTLEGLTPGLWFHCVPSDDAAWSEGPSSLETALLESPAALGRHLIPREFAFEVRAGERREYRVPLGRAERITGLVVDGDGTPIDRARVTAIAVESMAAQPWEQYAYARTGPDGVFELTLGLDRLRALYLEADDFREEALEGERLARWLQSGAPHAIELMAVQQEPVDALRLVFPDGAPARRFQVNIDQELISNGSARTVPLSRWAGSNDSGVVSVYPAGAGALRVVGLGAEPVGADASPGQHAAFTVPVVHGPPRAPGSSLRWWFVDASVEDWSGSGSTVTLEPAAELRVRVVGAVAGGFEVWHDDAALAGQGRGWWRRATGLRAE
ncbi:MAG: hypothetical protein AAFU73_03075 [Planctomycetota bacterium]